ncbi:MAG: hypothetical protein FJX75_29295 [Armatimonadetes bacterium]|nr:hypothetical protein [Armatimonadota bacterium]
MTMVRAWLELEDGKRVRVFLLSEDARQVLREEQAVAERLEHEVAASGEGSTAQQDLAEAARSIEEIMEELVGEVPEEAWKSLPDDLIENLDHYIYGIPKR